MVDLPTVDDIAKVVDKIRQSAPFETVNVSFNSQPEVVSTVVIDETPFSVTARILGPAPPSANPSSYAVTYTVLCGLNTGGGSPLFDYYEFAVPHIYNSTNYVLSITRRNDGQEQHAEVLKYTTNAIIRIAQQATTCYDVTFVGNVSV